MGEIIYNQKTIVEVARSLLLYQKSPLLAFYGAMGVGKTTLIKTLVNELGGIDLGHSPSFGLVNEYHDKNGNLLAYHFDFYRINSLEEALDIGLEEYFSSDVHLFIEWPEKIEPLLPEGYHKVLLYFIDETTRRIEY